MSDAGSVGYSDDWSAGWSDSWFHFLSFATYGCCHSGFNLQEGYVLFRGYQALKYKIFSRNV